MADAAATIPAEQTALSILARCEGIAHRMRQGPVTEFECDLLVHHMAPLLTEYRQMRQADIAKGAPQPGPPKPTAEVRREAPRLLLVAPKEG